LASESKPPQSVADALAAEKVARNREECNALYVALTRTQRTLVLSCAVPRTRRSNSWWQRLEVHAQAAPWCETSPVDAQARTEPAAVPDAKLAVDAAVGTAANVTANTSANAAVNTALDVAADADAEHAAVPAYIYLKALPNMATQADAIAQEALNNIAFANPVQTDTPLADSAQSRLGQAMHRLLEWANPAPGGLQGPPAKPHWNAEQLALLAQQWALDGDQIQAAQTMALGILQGQAAWAWDSLQLGWAGNEVAITQGTQLLRIDRLVQHRASATWWVLDYKSSASPQTQPELLSQLEHYRAAVAQAYPGHTVRAAFLTPQGQQIDLSAPLAAPLG
jgi:ATP-dependent helicase/nuclease subunit A